MSHHKNLPSFLCHAEEQPRLFRICQYGQSFIWLHLFHRNLCMTGMRRIKRIIKSTHKRDSSVSHMMLKYTEHFLWKLCLINPIVIINPRLCTPAQMQRGSHMRLRPLHDLFQLIPVIHIFKRNLFHRSSCNDKSIKLLLLDLFKRLIKLMQMTGGCIFRYMSWYTDKYNIHLKRCVRERPQYLQLCILL